MINEDELPEGYPYDLMFPFSTVNGVRLFPVVDADGWVSVDDCLPPDDADILVAHGGYVTALGSGIDLFSGEGREYISSTIHPRKLGSTTHWRPFPLPPKE